MDETAVVLVIGGCKYDYPMGDCMDIDVDASETIRGCAHELETHMTNKVRPSNLHRRQPSRLLIVQGRSIHAHSLPEE